MCELKHIHILDEPQKAAQRAQLQELVKAIADEIKQCGSDLNYYSDRKLVCEHPCYFYSHILTRAVSKTDQGYNL